MSDLRELYQEVILEHNRKPRNFQKMEDANRRAEGFNPLCGDRLTVYMKLKEDVIEEISFEGSGCAISKASSSMMTTSVKGKTVREAEALFEKFHQMITGKASTDAVPDLGKLAVFSGVHEFPARVKCASLAWHTLRSALKREGERIVSTEEEVVEEVETNQEELKEQVVKILQTCYDPEIPVNIHELGLIYDIDINPSDFIHIRMTLTSPACPVAGSLPPEVEAKVKTVPGVSGVKVEVVWDPPWTPEKMSEAAKLQLGMM